LLGSLLNHTEASMAQSARKPSAKARSAPPRSRPAGKDDSRVAGITITHPDRVLWPDLGISKLDLARYYERIAPRLLAQAAGRPISLMRCPQGPKGDVGSCFFQRHAGAGMSEHLKAVSVEGHGEGKPYIYIDDVKGLVSLIQMGTIELHAWNARVDAVKTPDRLIFDLDPGPGVPWAEVKQAARDVRTMLRKLGLVAFLKTTGGKGLHVVVPFRRGPDWAAVKEFARALAGTMAANEPDRFTVNSRKKVRAGRIFIDYLRNDETASAVTAYSVRARPGAPVSLPIDWKQLARLESGDACGMKRAVSQRGDPWRGMAQAARQSLPVSGPT
jgi:bifunctional non-homologous end joining protein LigD